MIHGISSYMNGMYPAYSVQSPQALKEAAQPDTGASLNTGASTEVAPGRKSSPAECKTCAERKYQDGSDEMVSFKSPTHISPSSSASSVMAHEHEHVSNAYKKASEENGKVLQATVTLKTAICPECGSAYVAGGKTNTSIQYKNEDNPYMQNKKSLDAQAYVGANLDFAV